MIEFDYTYVSDAHGHLKGLHCHILLKWDKTVLIEFENSGGRIICPLEFVEKRSAIMYGKSV